MNIEDKLNSLYDSVLDKRISVDQANIALRILEMLKHI